ncbi:DeoR/GlpR family DNA-binding transcription regulator [Aliihoeflea sp. PC F10.4]
MLDQSPREIRFPQERLRRMADLIAERGQISVEELLDIFAVSGPTIRRDLAHLAQAGVAVRTHGGVISADRAGGHEPLFMEKVRRQQSAKNQIAKAASHHIEDGMRVMLDSGTTCMALARLLAGRAMTVITLDIKTAEVAATGDTRVTSIGGQVRNGYFSVVGNETVDAIASQEPTDVFVLSADAVDLKGVSNVTVAEASVKEAALARARRTILVADHTKLDRREPAVVCAWDAIDLFITDRHPAAAAKSYEGAARQMEICQAGTDTKGIDQT